jgi:hypothetical protein
MTGTQTTDASGGAVGAKATTADTATTTQGATIPSAKTPALVFLADTCPIANVPSSYEFAFLIPVAIAAGGALINAVLPPLINGATGAVADFLQKRADDLNASSTAFTNGTLYTRPMDQKTGQLSAPVDRYGCLVFLRGGLSASGAAPTITDRWSNTYYSKVNDAISKSGNNKVTLTTPPEIYAEFNIHYQRLPVKKQPDKQATSGAANFLYQTIGFAPVYVDYETTGAARSSKKSKQLIFTLVLTANSIQSTSTSGTTILNQTIDLGNVDFGSVKKASDLVFKTPQYAKIPQPANVPIKGSDGKTITGYVDDSIPIAVQVSLTETENAGDVERAVAAALRTNESQISNAITQAIVGQLPKPAAQK